MQRAYLTMTALKRQMTTANNTAEFLTRGRKIIYAASAALEKWTTRRFDPYVATVRHDPRLKRHDGDIVEYTLCPRGDLMELTTLINGDGTTLIVDTDVEIIRDTSRVTNNITGIELVNELLNWEHNTSSRRKASIQLTGTWGYGYNVNDTGVVIGSTLNDSDTTVPTSGSYSFEQDQLLQVGNEIMRVTADATVTGVSSIGVERAYNGSTAASHALNDAIYIISFHPLVDRFMKRIAAWFDAQDASPLFGQVVLGDVAIPVDITKMPNDVQAMVETLKPLSSIKGT